MSTEQFPRADPPRPQKRGGYMPARRVTPANFPPDVFTRSDRRPPDEPAASSPKDSTFSTRRTNE